MAKVLVLFAHPGQRHSRVNILMAKIAGSMEGVTFVDLYADYPKLDIDIDVEQARLLKHDVIIFQFPIYWYSTPSILKEWQDLVLEYGFAYGHTGDKLAGKLFLPVITAGGPDHAYTEQGSNHFRLRALLSPLEQTANLCRMRFVAPYALFAAHDARGDGRAEPHLEGYRRLLEALRDETFDIDAAAGMELLSAETLPLRESMPHE
ncbi:MULTISPECIES: NAD(P)H-dependent oxidoreductase [unclassified Rhizobium]|uniref:NAD(P)H-dependent oxidoreductase n=1 Tax=unclassified Rhizobium TaxID=2613769 RepID=UPI0016147652|nr:NAD(P)H-dependent oxidoreductase [Rhizobium sp. UBA1881]